MKEDYLWEKTGKDEEIERLENALAAFRYRETAPPALPAKVLPFREKEMPRSPWRFAFAAVAACVAFVVISFGVWFQISDSEQNLSAAVEPKITIEFPAKTSAAEPNDSIIEKPEISKGIAKPKITKIKKRVPVRQNRIIAKNPKRAKPAVELTDEEKFAYNQLMLALSITGSKLRLVSDKVEGVEDRNAAR